MDLRYTQEDQAFRQEVRSWLEDNLPEEKPETIEERQAWHRTLYEAGYVGMGWPSKYGGRDARPMEQAIVGEELARVNAPPGVNSLGIAIVGPTLIHHGTEVQKQRFLKNILNGEELWCQLYSEPNSGSDLASLGTRAEIDGDTFIINGQKIWTSGGHDADWGLMLARTDPRAPKHSGISCILIDMNQASVDAPAVAAIGELSCYGLNASWRVVRVHVVLARAVIDLLDELACLRSLRLLDVLHESRDGDGGENADNRHDDHELDERETLLRLFP